ncbi:hypothetical protein FZC78_19700 [Rossellomorea vietnamensis]|uniref:Uncharacterized protein n=1 Tax=Rossellomorea vietnamensis TaxID=218284 RepID=A0A5D4NJ47_9BACI|nr:hypothetical protein FZC78_19700 [Rossellomorea vietnamensis]
MEAPCSGPTGKCSKAKKRRSFLLFALGYLTPRDWALQLDWGLTCPASPAGDRTPSAPILLYEYDRVIKYSKTKIFKKFLLLNFVALL